MEQKQIEEGNTLIHDWMGNRRMSAEGWGHCWQGGITVKDLKYHSSWDWIMPVAEKIEGLKTNKDEGEQFQYSITGDGIAITKFDDGSGVIANRFNEIGKSKLQSSWEVVVEFIQWYNSLTPKTLTYGSI